MEGSFKKQNIHGFFIINMESKIYITLCGLFTFFLLYLTVTSYKKIKGGVVDEENLGFISKLIINKKEAY